jgi:hypothetical protein
LREKAHALSEQFFAWDSIERKDNQKKITLNPTVKEQGLKRPYQEAFYTETLQVMWSKMRLLCF